MPRKQTKPAPWAPLGDFGDVFVANADGTFLCEECARAAEIDLGDHAVETWEVGGDGWLGPVVCSECQLSIPVVCNGEWPAPKGKDMKVRHRKPKRQNALATLESLKIPVGSDFHELSHAQVERLLAEADRVRYRRPANANGSRARYFHDRLQRHARIKD